MILGILRNCSEDTGWSGMNSAECRVTSRWGVRWCKFLWCLVIGHGYVIFSDGKCMLDSRFWWCLWGWGLWNQYFSHRWGKKALERREFPILYIYTVCKWNRAWNEATRLLDLFFYQNDLGLHPAGLQALYLPSLKTKERAQSQQFNRDIHGLMDGGVLHFWSKVLEWHPRMSGVANGG